MTLSEEHEQVFIVRVWREPRDIQGVEPTWRGVVEHVGTGERRYLTDLGELALFIGPHLDKMGVRPQRRSRVATWFRRLQGGRGHPVLAWLI
jgi:hypothetical protein